MIPSRGLRWSGQTISIGRRRIDAFSSRQFSSSVYHGPIRANPLLSKHVTSLLRTHAVLRANSNGTLRSNTGLRFASTTPISTSPPPAAPIAVPTEAVSSSTSTVPITEYTSSLDSVTELGLESLYDIPERIGYLKALGLEYGYGPTALMEWVLEHVHIFAGTPWWVSISLTAILVRAVLFKPYINAAENSARMATIQPLTAPITARMQAAAGLGNRDEAMQLRAELKRLHARAGIKVWRSFVPMLQVFAGYGTFVLLRAMSRIPVPGLETGGVLWFHNLTIPDPFWVLPIATSAILHWVLRSGGETGVSNLSPTMFNAMMWGLPAVSFGFTFWLPAALQLSFLVSGVLSFAQATFLRQPRFRSYMNMTPLPGPKDPGPKPSAYKGSMKLTADPVLSQSDLNSRFQGAQTASHQQTTNRAKKLSSSKGVMGNLVGKVTGTLGEIKEAGKGVYESSVSTMEKRSMKADVYKAKKYEEKRQEELKKQRWELENQKRAERSARKRENM